MTYAARLVLLCADAARIETRAGKLLRRAQALSAKLGVK
jgi:hypothetical protein